MSRERLFKTRKTLPSDTLRQHQRYHIHGNLIEGVIFEMASWAYGITLVGKDSPDRLDVENYTLLVDDDPSDRTPIVVLRQVNNEYTAHFTFFEFSTPEQALRLCVAAMLAEDDEARPVSREEALHALQERALTLPAEMDKLVKVLEIYSEE